ncbi:MAG: hypothetical protein AAFP70_13185 [Calditrichota bacterium]
MSPFLEKQYHLLDDVVDMARRGGKYYSFYGWSWLQDRQFKKRSYTELKAQQWQKFQRLIANAVEQIPFYKERFRAAGISPSQIKSETDLQRIPILTREDIRANYPDRIVKPNLNISPNDLGRSSGSTGSSVPFVRSKSWKRNNYYSLLMHQRWLGNPLTACLQTPQCSSSGCSVDNIDMRLEDHLRKLLVRSRLNPYFYLPTSANILGEDDSYFEQLLRILNRYRPTSFFGDPVYIGALARYMVHNNIHFPLKFIITTSELLTETNRQFLQEAFQCDVYNHYACSEIQGVADECEHHNLHVRMDTVLLEVLKDGRPAKPGERGEVIITDFENTTMPFIRYAVGDIATVGEADCTCGRKTQTLKRIEGRSKDFIKNEHNTWMGPHDIDQLFANIMDVDHYQFVKTNGGIRIKLQSRNRIADDTMDLIRHRTSRYFDSGKPIKIRQVRTIRPEPSNKYRFAYTEVQTASEKHSSNLMQNQHSDAFQLAG